MVSKYDCIRALRKITQDEEAQYILDEQEENLIHRVTGEILCSVDEYAQHVRKKLHCDFEMIHCEHVSLFVVYQCRECGTVIFASESYEDYDDNLCCPHCGGYETHFKFWTKEEIDADEKKQNTLKMFVEINKEEEAAAKRRKKRGLSDWEIWKKDVKVNENMHYTFCLECLNLFREGLKGLNLHITRWEREEDGTGFIGKKFRRIPLSLYAVYIQWIYPYSPKCHPSVRKYFPWQKKKAVQN